MNHIELFAGCGGLSLGLESEGFELLLANEISPMASETFAYNFFGEDLANNPLSESRVLWLKSNLPREEMPKRLREDPRSTAPSNISDLKHTKSLNGKLVVGGIKELNDWLEKSPRHLKKITSVKGGVDLVSGGPPCQSFSMAGLRQVDNERNVLPWEFARIISLTKPKIALLENVTGILRAFEQDRKKYYAWFEVAKAFAEVGYIPICLHINAKLAGVAQNRPRFIMIGLQKDLLKKIKRNCNETELSILEKPENFFKLVSKKESVEYSDLDYIDAMKESELNLYINSFLSPLVSSRNQFFTVSNAIDDLRKNGSRASKYVSLIHSGLSRKRPKNGISNNELRSVSPLVRRRFRIYQILNLVSDTTKKEIQQVLKGKEENLSKDCALEALQYDYLLSDHDYVKFSKASKLLDYLVEHQTKKQTQRALISDKPAPAALSIPDDACHYHHDEQRTLTVREMARIQSFPDDFIFRSKVTTGGKMRRFEVPQYTQVGNAVPPLLGKALGQTVKNILSKSLPKKKT